MSAGSIVRVVGADAPKLFVRTADVLGDVGVQARTFDGWLSSGKLVQTTLAGEDVVSVGMNAPLRTRIAKAIAPGGSVDPADYGTVRELASDAGMREKALAKRIDSLGLRTPFLDQHGTAVYHRPTVQESGALDARRGRKLLGREAATGEPQAGADDAARGATDAASPAATDKPHRDGTKVINGGIDKVQSGVGAVLRQPGVRKGIAFGATLGAPIAVGASLAGASRDSGADAAQRRALVQGAEATLLVAGLSLGRFGATQANRAFGYTLATGAAIPFAIPVAKTLQARQAEG